MPLRYRSLQNHGTFFITTSTYNHVLRFKKKEDYEIVLTNMEFYRIRDNAKVHGYVVMPNHMHLLVSIQEEKNISFFVRDLKKRIVFEYFNSRNVKIQKFWQHRFDDLYIISEKTFAVKLNYIHNNPVKAGLVENPEDWECSSAEYYKTGKQGIIKIDRLALW